MIFLKKSNLFKKKKAERTAVQSVNQDDVSVHNRVVKSRQALVDLIKFLDSL
ncbi:MAG TPA: hypothetical protein VIN08_01065 [Ohtaekwangia sp.]|uniref:hypothetical protein n=1 Tax=Ohtaekwangia sp. TaxID=2066019 RepID=UPI002F956090